MAAALYAYKYLWRIRGYECDGEWNDARQSLFSELIINYGRELKITEYIQRGLAALKASFIMMYCPENAKTKEQWEKDGLSLTRRTMVL